MRFRFGVLSIKVKMTENELYLVQIPIFRKLASRTLISFRLEDAL